MNLDESEKLAAEMRIAHLIKTLMERNQELEAMLKSVGAGGVSAQRVTQAADHIAQDRKMVAAPVEVVIDFERVGSAGPFEVVEWRVAIPVVTMLDLARMLKPTTDALSAAQVVLPEPVAAQIRHIKEERWRTIVLDLYDLFAGGEYERRYIYTDQQVRELLAAHGIAQEKQG